MHQSRSGKVSSRNAPFKLQINKVPERNLWRGLLLGAHGRRLSLVAFARVRIRRFDVRNEARQAKVRDLYRS